jgi:branched-chain amino acid transport system ATP-binding protein
MSLLQVRDVQAAYGESQVLFGMGLSLQPGEVMGLLGRNGMGKTTLIRSILGLKSVKSGQVIFDGQDITNVAADRVARMGLAVVPEGRQVFPNLTVKENLVATARLQPGNGLQPWTLARVYGFFPRLQERENNLGSQLSGGEQQMLAIGRALMTNPRLVVLDEATEGLAPIIRAEIWQALTALKAEGLSMIVIDKNLTPLLALADRHFVIEKGQMVWSGSSSALRANSQIVHTYLGV